MSRYLAGVLVLALTGIPLLNAPSGVIAVLGVSAAALCAAGILRPSIPLLAAGASLSLGVYALALWLSAGPPDVGGAVGFGVILATLFQVVEFAARFRGATVDPRVIRGQVRYWTGTGLLGAGAAILMAIGAGGVPVRLPPAAYPVAGTLGALAVFLAAMRLVLHSARGASTGSTGETR